MHIHTKHYSTEMLLVGAVRQMGAKLADTEARLALAESRLAALPEGGR